MIAEKTGELSYTCATGHIIARDDLERRTEVQSLDRGALVRVCREHGAPVAISAFNTIADRGTREASSDTGDT
ncbi:MAG: hypothetical protein PVSMB7_26950 [Chloroflexota bacterium]